MMNYDADQAIEHYRRMCLIRAFETAVDRLFSKGKISGTAHLCIGQEASAMGAVAGLAAGDLVTSNHRGHGHLIAMGGEPRRIMAELFGKSTGYSRGRGGSQHIADTSIGFLGSNGITGGMVPVAGGAALTQKMLQTDKVVLCFLGDGASGQGAFYEALNMATNWKLPVIFFCENNLYAMSTGVEEAFAEPEVAKRVEGFGLPADQVDGNDYFAVRQATADARGKIADGNGPILIEAFTYRQCGHSKSDNCAYRTDEEERRWARRDPIDTLADDLTSADIATGAELQQLRREADDEIEGAIEFAENSPEPEPQTATDDVFADV